MNFETFKAYCLSKKGAVQDFPFDDETLVFKVGGKMFALTSINSKVFWISLKCDPFLAVALRDEYEAIKPGYHLNKRHWNTVIVDGSIPEDKLLFMIDMSYSLVYRGLTKRERMSIELAP